MPAERQSRTDIGERNTDEVEMSGVALCSKSLFVADTQLVTGSSSSVHHAAVPEQIEMDDERRWRALYVPTAPLARNCSSQWMW